MMTFLLWLTNVRAMQLFYNSALKGKGTIVTYFLSGKDGYTKELPNLSNAAGIEMHSFKW